MSQSRDIGAMRFTVEVFAPARVKDGAGGFKRSDNRLGQTQASIRPASASEQFRAQRMEMLVSHVIKMRKLFNVPHNAIIREVGGDVEYRVTSATDDDMRGRFWTLMAVVGGPQ